MTRFTCHVCGRNTQEAGSLSKRVGRDDDWLCPEHFAERNGTRVIFGFKKDWTKKAYGEAYGTKGGVQRMIPFTIWRKPKGSSARNWIGVTMVDPDHPRRAAIWAQEAWESMWKINPINFAKRVFSKDARREMEIMGHEVEVQAAWFVYGDQKAQYRLNEALSLERHYDIFAGHNIFDIQLAMLKRQPEARAWVLDNFDRIKAKQ